MLRAAPAPLGTEGDGDGGADGVDVPAELRAAFTNERCAPELLPHRDDLVQHVLRLCEAQQEAVAAMGEGETLKRGMYETELDRLKFMLVGYLRTRLRKIGTLAIHLGSEQANPEAIQCLSEQEKVFASGYTKLCQEHVDRCVWDLVDTSRLPEQLKHITAVKAVAAGPKLDAHVFCRVLRDCPPFTLPEGDQVELFAGEVALLRYEALKPLVDDGSVVLV